jgi:cytochrome c-type biogenesis protein CcmF
VIAEAGHYALVLALGLALIQSTVPLLGTRWGDHALMNVARSSALAQLLFVAASFALLTMLHVMSDFSVVNVFENSHSMKPLLYKITGVWGNHEGSMLLWVFILALFGGLVAAFGNNLPLSLRAHVLAVQGWIASAFYLFILLTSNPFLRIASPPIEGRDLNPVLQDIGLAVHPPMLYLGYVGFSISFSFAVAALIEGRIDAAWARWVRPWTLMAWIFLTLGIAMGSYWAYYELGWGGWWFWDPVENASLMPWLAGTALLHSAVVMEKRNALKVWTILLSILTFSLSLLGTFLVRSGVLTSVHAFANDPARGVFILLILCLFIGGSLSLYAWRASALKQGGLFAPISREGALVLNNLFLVSACATVFIGTLYPLALEVLTGDKISVGPPFFNLTFGPLFVPLMLAVPFGPLLAWKRGDLLGAAQRLTAAGIAALVAIAVAWAWTYGGSTFAPLAIGLAVFVIAGSLCDLAERAGLFRTALPVALRRARGLPRATWGTAFAHAGVGVALIGIVCETTWNTEYIGSMMPSDVARVAGYQLKLDDITQRQGPNFREMIAQFTVSLDGETLRVMTPSKRNFTTRGSSTTEAALLTRGASQLYVSLGETSAGAIAVRIYHKPLVLLIWWGPVLMAFGGLLSLSDRRLRVGAPKPARKPDEAARALQPEPAE